uniref:XPO1A n=1 Tax=Arundo donax TaxID=35708 RepID=A0A0A9EHY3_ARUDO
MHLMHELKQFVDHSFQKLPVSPEKSRILTNNIHDVTCNDSFIIFSLCDFTEV